MFVVAGLTVFVDKRITLGAFKYKLEPFVQVQAENFKVSTESEILYALFLDLSIYFLYNIQCGQHIFPILFSYSESTGLFYSE